MNWNRFTLLIISVELLNVFNNSYLNMWFILSKQASGVATDKVLNVRIKRKWQVERKVKLQDLNEVVISWAQRLFWVRWVATNVQSWQHNFMIHDSLLQSETVSGLLLGLIIPVTVLYNECHSSLKARKNSWSSSSGRVLFPRPLWIPKPSTGLAHVLRPGEAVCTHYYDRQNISW